MFAQRLMNLTSTRIGHRGILLLTLFAAAAILLSACSGQAGTAASSGANPAAGTPSGPVSFSKDIQPILQSRCAGCHGGQSAARGLDVTSYASLMAGSQNGPVVKPGDPDNSLMIQLIQQGIMPKSGPRLLPSQVQMLIDWVKAGAPNN